MVDRFKRWWFLWWDELVVIVVASSVICGIIAGGWYLYQTTPSALAEAVVKDHRYTEQYDETHDGGSYCVYRDSKSGICYAYAQNPDIHHTHCLGGCYEIRVYGCSNDRRGVEHCRHEWKDVNQKLYDDCRKGRLWRRGEPKCISQ